ncbi:hypothetical protein IWQ60_010885 [Tieghemiomyces parasiticus]|uniref:Ion transport domain-containing protein n=1 Tax=Tieghemiomyces parasiticus TaxID=78921 RepID=A0A9W8DM63_9FUNG|nr:hypothetical protein IWQ60_010885 [Tieghemiomyces parasiticus]
MDDAPRGASGRRSAGYYPRSSSDTAPMLPEPDGPRPADTAGDAVLAQSATARARRPSALSGRDDPANAEADNGTNNGGGGGLTFLPFDVIDPDYSSQRRYHRASDRSPTTSPASASTRNPFALLARRFGNTRGPSGENGAHHTRGAHSGIVTIADGIMPDGRAYDADARRNVFGDHDQPLRRYSTTAINVPEARPIGPVTTEEANRIAADRSAADVSATPPHAYHLYNDGPLNRATRPRRSRSRVHSRLTRYGESPSLHPFEMAVENVGLFHDPLFGLPTLDAHSGAATGIMDIPAYGAATRSGLRRRPRSLSSSSSESESTSTASSSTESERRDAPGVLSPVANVTEPGIPRTRRRSTVPHAPADNYPLGGPVRPSDIMHDSSRGMSLSRRARHKQRAERTARPNTDTDQVPPADQEESPRNSASRRRPPMRYYHHPLPAAMNPLAPVMRNNEAAQMRCWWKRELFLLMEDPSSGWCAFAISVFIVFVIISGTVVTIIETIPSLLVPHPEAWFVFESAIVGIFTAEFILRLIAHSDSRRQLFRHVFSVLTVVDLVAIIPYYIELGVDRDRTFEFRFTAIRLLRLFRVFSVFKYSNLLQLSVEVMLIATRRSIDALMALIFFMIMAMLIFSTILYYFERGQWDAAQGVFINRVGDPSQFDSIPAALWFASVAVTTTGFGDVAPKTVGGKIFTFPLIAIGLLLIALPSIIVGREFTVVWQAMKLRRRKEIQLVQQAQREARREARRQEKRQLRQAARQAASSLDGCGRGSGSGRDGGGSGSGSKGKLPSGDAMANGKAKRGDGRATGDSSHTLAVSSRSAASVTRKPASPPDAQVIEIPESDVDGAALPPLEGRPNTTAVRPFVGTRRGARSIDSNGNAGGIGPYSTVLSNETRVDEETRTSVDSRQSEPDMDHRHPRFLSSSRNPYRFDDDRKRLGRSNSYDLERTTTKDLHHYSPDEDFVAKAMGLGMTRSPRHKKRRPSAAAVRHNDHHRRPVPPGPVHSHLQPPGQPQPKRQHHPWSLHGYRERHRQPAVHRNAATGPILAATSEPEPRQLVGPGLATKSGIHGAGHFPKHRVPDRLSHTDDNDVESLDLDADSHVITTDPGSSSDDEGEDDEDLDNDDEEDEDDDEDENGKSQANDMDENLSTIDSDVVYRGCLDDETKERINMLPQTINDLKAMFHSMQENQLTIQKAILLMSQRIEGIENRSAGNSGPNPASGEPSNNFLSLNQTPIARSTSALPVPSRSPKRSATRNNGKDKALDDVTSPIQRRTSHSAMASMASLVPASSQGAAGPSSKKPPGNPTGPGLRSRLGDLAAYSVSPGNDPAGSASSTGAVTDPFERRRLHTAMTSERSRDLRALLDPVGMPSRRPQLPSTSQGPSAATTMTAAGLRYKGRDAYLGHSGNAPAAHISQRDAPAQSTMTGMSNFPARTVPTSAPSSRPGSAYYVAPIPAFKPKTAATKPPPAEEESR